MRSRTASAEARARASLEGFRVLGDAELLALLLSGRAASRAAESVLEQAGGLEGLARLGAARLGELPGVGAASAARLLAAAEIGRRIRERASAPRPRFATPDAVAAWFAPRIGLLDHEQMWVVSVDGCNRLRGMRRVAQGGAHGLSVSAREILGAALCDGASAFVLVHNHPSGSPEPSEEDVAMTTLVARAARIVGVPLLDHVVVAAGGEHTSMLESGCLESSATRGGERESWPRASRRVFALHDGKAAEERANQDSPLGVHFRSPFGAAPPDA